MAILRLLIINLLKLYDNNIHTDSIPSMLHNIFGLKFTVTFNHGIHHLYTYR